MNDFQENLKEILDLYEKTGSLEKTIKASNLTPAQIEKLRETFAYIDKIAENDESLKEAKERGETRDGWLTMKVVETAQEKGLTDEQTDILVTDITKASDEMLNRRSEEE